MDVSQIGTVVQNYTIKQSLDINSDKMSKLMESVPNTKAPVSNGSTGFKVDVLA